MYNLMPELVTLNVRPPPAFTPPELTPLIARVLVLLTNPAWQEYPHQSHAGAQTVPGTTV